jgi:hypothetical protein
LKRVIFAPVASLIIIKVVYDYNRNLPFFVSTDETGTVRSIFLVDWPERFGPAGTENNLTKLIRASPTSWLGTLKKDETT